MPSVVIGSNPLASGPQQVVSGNPWSGFQAQMPAGGIQFRWDRNASGQCYITLSGFIINNSGFLLSGNPNGSVMSGGIPARAASGGPTVNSGMMLLSGGMQSGGMDGFPLGPGDSYFIPRIAFRTSGTYNVFAMADAACSGGFGRLYFEVF